MGGVQVDSLYRGCTGCMRDFVNLCTIKFCSHLGASEEACTGGMYRLEPVQGGVQVRMTIL